MNSLRRSLFINPKMGFVYVAVGNDRQWKTIVSLDIFKSLDKPEYETNAGRIQDVVNLNQAINEITKNHSSEKLIELLTSITVPNQQNQNRKRSNRRPPSGKKTFVFTGSCYRPKNNSGPAAEYDIIS